MDICALVIAADDDAPPFMADRDAEMRKVRARLDAAYARRLINAEPC
jgi:hypothetical protein